MMNELTQWLEENKIRHRRIDQEVVEIEGLGKMYMADLSNLNSIFKGTEGNLQFNLMERPEVLLAEGIRYVAFPFGDNWYYYDIEAGFRFNILKYVGRRVPCKVEVPFVNLGVHTPYELLNGSGDVADWVRKAVYLGHTALGICDRNTMAATLSLQKECAKAGIRHVFGYSCTLEHEGEKVGIKIYSQSQRGLRNLLRIQKAVMVDSVENTLPLPELLRRADGNVLVFGKLASYWMESHPSVLKVLKEAFNGVYYQVDLSEYKAERIDAEVLQAVARFFDHFYNPATGEFSVEPVLICDNYYLDRGDAKNKIVLNKIAAGAAHCQSDDQYFKDADEHWDVICRLFDGDKWDVEELFARMCRHTVQIAAGTEASYETDRNFMPRYDMTPEEKDKYRSTHEMFLSLLEEGFQRLVPKGRETEYRERLEKELYILESTDNVDYMLVQYDTVNWARSQGILVGCGRGSAGGSLVLYLLGITLIDPIKYDLLFERFLLPERTGLYQDQVTVITEDILSRAFVSVQFDDKRCMRLDRDAQLRIIRNDAVLTVYADQLHKGDEVLFDNRDLLFTIDRIGI